jgi:hypothetical protein
MGEAIHPIIQLPEGEGSILLDDGDLVPSFGIRPGAPVKQEISKKAIRAGHESRASVEVSADFPGFIIPSC